MMGSQVSSITCVALTQQQSHFLKCLSSQELLGKSLKHGTSPYTKPQTLATTKGVYFNSHSIGPSQRPTNSRETGPDPPSETLPLVDGPAREAWLDSYGAANRAPLLSLAPSFSLPLPLAPLPTPVLTSRSAVYPPSSPPKSRRFSFYSSLPVDLRYSISSRFFEILFFFYFCAL